MLNFEHDLALASGKPFYIPPKVAVAMNEDMAPLPLWVCPGATVLTKAATLSCLSPETLRTMHTLGAKGTLAPAGAFEPNGNEAYNAWGWDPQSAQQLQRFGHTLPADTLPFIKEWSHRGKTVLFLQRFAEAGLFPAEMLPRIARTSAEVEEWTTQRQLVLKMPLSGSGRGIWWALGGYDFNVQRWSKRTLQTQGCVLCEPVWQKTGDFAMEFHCQGGKARFAGYSQFVADGAGVYRCNLLRTDAAIAATLSAKIGAETLERVKTMWIEMLEETIATRYSGIVGIDMLTGLHKGEERLNPCVEINLRTTMGMVARTFFDRWVHPGSEGEFRTIHFKEEGALARHAEEEAAKHPPVITGGRITRGYALLTSGAPEARYGVEVEIKETE